MQVKAALFILPAEMQRAQSHIALILLSFFLIANFHDWVPHLHHSHAGEHHHSDTENDHHDHDGLISILSDLLHQHTHVPHEEQAEMDPETTLYKAPTKQQVQHFPGIVPNCPNLVALHGLVTIHKLPEQRLLLNYDPANSSGRAPPSLA